MASSGHLIPQNNPTSTTLKMAMFGGSPKKTPPGEKSKKSRTAAKMTAEDEAVSIFKAKFAKIRKKTPIIESNLRLTFREMCKVYGTDNALTMVKNLPKVLEFNRKNFQPTFEILCNKFDGKDNTLAMLLRNPGLLNLRPQGYCSAEDAGDETMTFSYIIAYTRPAGPLLLTLFFGILLLPAFEMATGIEFRASFLPPIFKELKFID